MDPLSICASAVALIGASKAVTKALYTFTRYATHAEAHVASLRSEITTLTGFLASINKTLRSCRRNGRALALVEGELWRQSDLALQDCEATLMELSTFVARLKTSNKTPIWRAKVAIDMSIHANKLEQFRARLKRSNSSLQTVLQTITVSISLQNNASQESILVELGKLKSTIEEAVWIAKRPPVGTHHCQPSLRAAVSETVATKNLKGLVKAAEGFYSSATTTVGSSLGGGSIADWTSPARETAHSITGLSPFWAEHVHDYLHNIGQESNPLAATITEARDFHSIDFPENCITDESTEPMENHTPILPMKPASDVVFQLPVVEVLEDCAIEKMKIRHFDSAAAFLNKALSGEMGPVPDEETRMRLHTRLGICYVLQRNIPEAEKVISKLERSGGLENIEVLHLMHALVMVYFAQFDFPRARDLCTRVVDAKTRLLGESHPDTFTSLGFLGHLYDLFNRPIQWEASRRKLPPDYVYSHPESEFDYLAQHATLLPATATLGSEQVELPCTSFSHDSESVSSQTTANRCAPNHGLRRALTRYESQQTDTMKAFVSMTVVHPDDGHGEDYPAAEIMVTRNGQRRLISRSMTTMRRHFSTWRSSKPATERKERIVAGDPSIRRCRTVLHKAPPASQMQSAGSDTGLVRAKRFLGILKTEMPMIIAPTEEIVSTEEIALTGEIAPAQEFFPPVELDSKCIAREDLTKQPAGTRGQQAALEHHGALASKPVAPPPSKIRRVMARPLDMSLNMIPELPELDSGDGYDVGHPAAIVCEDSEGSSDGSISRGSSVSDNRSTVSGSSYSTNTTVSEAASAASDCRDGDTSTVPQRHEMVQVARNGSISLFDRPKSSTPPPGKDALLPFLGSFSGTWQLASLAAAHRSTNSTYKSYRRNWPPDASPAATDTKYGLPNTGYPSQSLDPTTQVLPYVSQGGWGDGSGESHGLKRTFSWSYGDENLSILKLPTRISQKAPVQVL